MVKKGIARKERKRKREGDSYEKHKCKSAFYFQRKSGAPSPSPSFKSLGGQSLHHWVSFGLVLNWEDIHFEWQNLHYKYINVYISDERGMIDSFEVLFSILVIHSDLFLLSWMDEGLKEFHARDQSIWVVGYEMKFQYVIVISLISTPAVDRVSLIIE